LEVADGVLDEISLPEQDAGFDSGRQAGAQRSLLQRHAQQQAANAAKAIDWGVAGQSG
jgi:hypothetical protein